MQKDFKITFCSRDDSVFQNKVIDIQKDGVRGFPYVPSILLSVPSISYVQSTLDVPSVPGILCFGLTTFLQCNCGNLEEAVIIRIEITF